MQVSTTKHRKWIIDALFIISCMLQIALDTVRTHTHTRRATTAQNCNAMFSVFLVCAPSHKTKPNAQYTLLCEQQLSRETKTNINFLIYLYQTKNEIEINWVWINFTHHGNSMQRVSAHAVVDVCTPYKCVCECEYNLRCTCALELKMLTLMVNTWTLNDIVANRIGSAKLMEWFFN